MDAHREVAWGTDPSHFEPAAVRGAMRRLERWFGPGNYFGVKVSGVENIPAAPSLLVSNHSGGLTILDGWGLAYVWHRHFACERPLHVMAHEMVFSLDRTGKTFAQLGALRADPGRGQQALAGWGRDLLVMPGGDVDVFRPYKDRYKVCFAGRTGYARLAIKSGVPIVPVANAGAHETFMVLSDGARLAARLRLPQIARARTFPIHLSFPWGLAVGPWLHIPPPVDLRYRVGPPIPPPLWEGPGDPPEAMVRALDAEVQAATQALLDDLRATAPSLRERLACLRRVGRLVPRRAWSRRQIPPENMKG
jgi:1-acyl-sn-glycerol-3-phosphate acyltransferase